MPKPQVAVVAWSYQATPDEWNISVHTGPYANAEAREETQTRLLLPEFAHAVLLTTPDLDAVQVALEDVVTDLDYDLAKAISRDEETGEDTWPKYTARFVETYASKIGVA